MGRILSEIIQSWYSLIVYIIVSIYPAVGVILLYTIVREPHTLSRLTGIVLFEGKLPQLRVQFHCRYLTVNPYSLVRYGNEQN